MWMVSANAGQRWLAPDERLSQRDKRRSVFANSWADHVPGFDFWPLEFWKGRDVPYDFGRVEYGWSRCFQDLRKLV